MSINLTKFAALACALIASAPAVAEDVISTVRFPAGASSASLSGNIKGDDSATYKLHAAAGQKMTITLKPTNLSCNFNVTRRGQDEALFVGSMNGDAYSGTLPETGTYLAMVYLMRNAARRSESCAYKITFEVR